MSKQQERVLEILNLYAQGTVTRREAMRRIAALTAVGAAALSFGPARAQDSNGSPEAAGSPVPGPMADGTNLWKVTVGAMDMANGIDMQAFFPGAITINAGDTVWWEFTPMGMPAFHTVTFTSGDPVPPIFVPDIVDGTPVASPEGPPRLLINPAAAFPDGRTEYDGTGMVNSGLDILRTPETPPYMLKFTTPGTYEYFCVAHAVVMKGSVTVQEAGSDLPMDAAGYEAQAQTEIADLAAVGQAAIDEGLAAEAMTEDGAAWDVSAGLGGMTGARVMRFIPQEITIKVGDTVRWTNRSDGEPHTVTFLGGTEPPVDSIVEPQPEGPPKIVQSYTTFLPTPETDFGGTGYRNSGFLGLPPEVNEMLGLLGPSYNLTFTAAGEYPYYCVLHAGGPDDTARMAGKIIVTE